MVKNIWRYAAAVILIVGIGAYLYTWNNKKTPASTSEASAKAVKNDILPGRDRAVLTLSSGQQVVLDSAAAETIRDPSLSIENNKGHLIYFDPRNVSEGGNKGDQIAINTMTTPRGGQYQLTLADGTRVWLNAASSITYPTSFTAKTREVSVTGEAYFEVAKNAEKPFIVKTPGEDITVLGTSFNVNAYEEEGMIKTSLVDGLVKIEGKMLRPGYAYENGKIGVTSIDQDLAWKNGVFNFDNLTAQAALRQLARWYDVEIVYEGKIPDKILGGKMGRNLTLQQALKVLDGIIAKFRLEGKQLHVSPL